MLRANFPPRSRRKKIRSNVGCGSADVGPRAAFLIGRWSTNSTHVRHKTALSIFSTKAVCSYQTAFI
jgi:hypothetical protein